MVGCTSIYLSEDMNLNEFEELQKVHLLSNIETKLSIKHKENDLNKLPEEFRDGIQREKVNENYLYKNDSNTGYLILNVELENKYLAYIVTGPFTLTEDSSQKEKIKCYKYYHELLLKQIQAIYIGEENKKMSRALMKTQEKLKAAQLENSSKEMIPHFIFNTLNLMSATAYFEGAFKTEKLIYSLSDLTRYTVKSNVLVTLEEEIKLLKEYLFIQSERFGERIRFYLDISDEVLQRRIPILSIQPLIENAIIYGVSPNVEGGEIWVMAKQTNKEVVVSVLDSGNTFKKERFEEVINNETKTSIGLKNINHRIQHYFGSEFGMRFIEDPKLTRVQIHLPL